jgi:hypothetical protein
MLKPYSTSKYGQCCGSKNIFAQKIGEKRRSLLKRQQSFAKLDRNIGF